MTSAAESQRRRALYVALSVTSLAVVICRTLLISSALGDTPLLSANDRSRWCTVRSLIDHGTYEIDEVIFRRDGRRDREWYTIDMVRHRGDDGHEHYYSSKPPLLATLVAGPYWLLKQLTGWTLAERPFAVVRLLLPLINVLPLGIYFLFLAILVDRIGGSHWGRLFVMAAATWGTFLTTFAVTLNNHLPAAISVLAALFCTLEARSAPTSRAKSIYFFLAGASAALAAANELPALSFLAMVTLVVLCSDVRGMLFAFVPGVLLVAAGFFGTNYVAHASWRPPYAHRSDGAVLAKLPIEDGRFAAAELADRLTAKLRAEEYDLSDATQLEPAVGNNRWMLWDPAHQLRFAVIARAGTLEVRQWDNWYEYERSYWLPGRKQGVDRGEPSRAVYLFHMSVGHRGILSLTPIWMLSLWGAMIWLVQGPTPHRRFALAVVALTAVCLTFYVMRPLADRNYGGVAAGFRWMFWFTPLWLLCALPAADVCSRHTGLRWLAGLLLAVSVFSALFPALNPWQHSWIYQLGEWVSG